MRSTFSKQVEVLILLLALVFISLCFRHSSCDSTHICIKHRHHFSIFNWLKPRTTQRNILMTLLQWNPGLTICKGSSKVILLNREYRYTGLVPHTFYCNFCWAGKRLLIVIPGISLYRRSLNRGSTVPAFLPFPLR